ncbi:hypothetical protein EI42_00449 [Thermosporothrix hazakensis]|uniref:Uncharacterized protein n=1 Tax=Thermosporothrix hazakensis TaxID=644383 RepID=A0A326UD73_THEHA|nr:zf-HC2 domain-containing protein [Thermosporothrix hazakensis]PZW36276.1 hypothetical protein EI42_00449 [Thermosporothrix hazakensis]GCE46925.1 hypothetical protein KTH_17940 [Thermosporothrix hazakensis]
MNCSQVRELLAIYRDHKKEKADLAELEAHLARCSACRRAQNEYRLIGEGIRSLPTIEPSPEAHRRLMQALAAEHTRFIQRNASTEISTPTPEFLKPYLKEQQATGRRADALTAFSTAETGPIPVLHPQHRRPRPLRMNQFAVIGLAAAFLLFIMVGGLTSLALMSQSNTNQPVTIKGGGPITNSVHERPQIAVTNYTTQTDYTHVASAISTRDSIYYTAYKEGEKGELFWTLQQLDTRKQQSTPLLNKDSSSSLYLLQYGNNWLVWFQYDPPKDDPKKASKQNESETKRTWSIQALYLGSPGREQPLTLFKGTFNPKAAPEWVHSPVQGTAFYQNHFLFAWIDEHGTSFLTQYTLEAGKKPVSYELAQGEDQHILTSPTATSDGSSIYWGEEWLDQNNIFHGNVWQQQVLQENQNPSSHRMPNSKVEKSLFRDDEVSFHPQVVGNTLFVLSTKVNENEQPGPKATSTANAAPSATKTAQSTATPTGTATPEVTSTPTATPQPDSIIPSAAEALDLAQPDSLLTGVLLAYALHDNSQHLFKLEDNVKTALAPQGGDRFLVWERSDKSFSMYDVTAGNLVTVGNAVPNNAAFLRVNGDTAVWMVNQPNTAENGASQQPNKITFNTFSWPKQTDNRQQ